MRDEHQVKIGLLTDLHYDGCAVAMNRLYDAVAQLKYGDVHAMVVMGDLVNAESERHAIRLLNEVSALCDAFKGPIYYMPGNHDLDHLSKAQFYNALGRAGDPSRYSFYQGGCTFICLDGNFSPDGTEYSRGNFQWQEAVIPDEELVWLEEQIEKAVAPVALVCHQRLDKACTHAVRNIETVRKIIEKSGKVNAVFQGHNHEDDLVQINGTTYYTLSALKDGAGPAVVEIEEDHIRLLRDFQLVELA